VVATISSNVRASNTVGTASSKHIGIHHMGKVWHYLTSRSAVFGDTPTEFRKRMTKAYGPTTVYFYSDFVR